METGDLVTGDETNSVSVVLMIMLWHLECMLRSLNSVSVRAPRLHAENVLGEGWRGRRKTEKIMRVAERGRQRMTEG